MPAGHGPISCQLPPQPRSPGEARLAPRSALPGRGGHRDTRHRLLPLGLRAGGARSPAWGSPGARPRGRRQPPGPHRPRGTRPPRSLCRRPPREAGRPLDASCTALPRERVEDGARRLGRAGEFSPTPAATARKRKPGATATAPRAPAAAGGASGTRRSPAGHAPSPRKNPHHNTTSPFKRPGGLIGRAGCQSGRLLHHAGGRPAGDWRGGGRSGRVSQSPLAALRRVTNEARAGPAPPAAATATGKRGPRGAAVRGAGRAGGQRRAGPRPPSLLPPCRGECPGGRRAWEGMMQSAGGPAPLPRWSHGLAAPGTPAPRTAGGGGAARPSGPRAAVRRGGRWRRRHRPAGAGRAGPGPGGGSGAARGARPGRGASGCFGRRGRAVRTARPPARQGAAVTERARPREGSAGGFTPAGAARPAPSAGPGRDPAPCLTPPVLLFQLLKGVLNVLTNLSGSQQIFIAPGATFKTDLSRRAWRWF